MKSKAAKKYLILLADPPWPFKTWSQKGQGKSASRHYDVMPIGNEIDGMDIRDALSKMISKLNKEAA